MTGEIQGPLNDLDLVIIRATSAVSLIDHLLSNTRVDDDNRDRVNDMAMLCEVAETKLEEARELLAGAFNVLAKQQAAPAPAVAGKVTRKKKVGS